MKSPSKKLLLSLEFLLYAALTALMLHATWLTWPDAFIDFSRELYLPWRVFCGDVLYRDLAYYFGPVSVYTNAALFALLGRPSIHALFALNFAFWLATLLALRAILRRIASPLASILSVSGFILLFSFSRYLFVGNYNFLAPYSHEITRGFLFALLSLLSLDSALRRFPTLPPFPRFPVRFFFPGALCALVLFTKPELVLATVAALAALFVLHAGHRPSRLFRPLLSFSGALLATLALVVAPFAVAFQSIPKALHDTLFKLYLDCFNPALTSLPFFQGILGTDHLVPNILHLVAGAVFAILPFLLARLALPRLKVPFHRLLATVLFSVLAAAIGWFAWFRLNAALSLAPIVLLVFLAGKRGQATLAEVSGRSSSEKPESGILNPSTPLAAAFALFAFLLVSKMLFNSSIVFYGFVLALPAFCCAVILAFRRSRPFHSAFIAGILLLAFLSAGLRLNAATLRNHAIHAPVFDATCRTADFQAQAFNAALSWLRENTPAESTLAVLPEGALFNVFANRPNSTPYISLPITDIPRYDSEKLLAAYSNSPPDTLVLVAKLGEPRFGIDYAQNLMACLDPLYTPAYTISLPSPTGPTPYLVIARPK